MDESNNKGVNFENDDFESWLEKHDQQRAIEEEQYRRKIQQAKAAALEAQQQQNAAKQDRQSAANRSLESQLNRADSNGNIPISRREVVKNFHVDIDENALHETNQQSEEEQQHKDKAIYFASRQPSRAAAARRNVGQNKNDEEKKRVNELRKKEKKQIARLKRIMASCVLVLCSTLLSIYVISCLNDVLALGRSDELVTVSIEKGSGSEEIIDALGDSNLIKHKWFCKLFTDFRKFDKKKYLNGVYYLTADMGVEGMLNAMRENQTSDETIRLYFPEGWTIQQMVEKLDKNNVCPKEYIYTALREVAFENAFIENLPTDGSRYFNLEGYLFPDTYDFFVSEKEHGIGENPNSIVRKLLKNFESKWTEIYDKRAKELGLTQDEVIIIASIIQKEAANKEQMTAISSVIHNRLNNPASYPTLGCDSTKNYVTNYLTQAIGSAAASAYIANYDTNGTRSGLPAGPICNPGTDAIEAALNPDDTKYFYFCHNNKGKIYLAKTYDEFQRNWTQVLKDNEESAND